MLGFGAGVWISATAQAARDTQTAKPPLRRTEFHSTSPITHQQAFPRRSG
ncbi:hypothetical protein KCP70_18510 [Salmonella enterica subsp. enterica]|nr:hypothetical protein KCP70_18510 [Salmonella enterica subsp. enterica]